MGAGGHEAWAWEEAIGGDKGRRRRGGEGAWDAVPRGYELLEEAPDLLLPSPRQTNALTTQLYVHTSPSLPTRGYHQCPPLPLSPTTSPSHHQTRLKPTLLDK